MGSVTSADERPLRPGDVVEVRSAAEILATLDGDGALDKMPFMPEMVPSRGSALHGNAPCRQDLRHDRGHRKPSHARHRLPRGSPLRRVGPRRLPGGLQALLEGSVASPCRRSAQARSMRATRMLPSSSISRRPGRGPCASSAASGLRSGAARQPKRSRPPTPLKTSDLPQYWRELTNGNFGLLRFIGLAGPRVRHGDCEPCRPAQAAPIARPGEPIHSGQSRLTSSPATSCRCGLRAEIAATLDEDGLNRGLSFDREMLPYCGRTLPCQGQGAANHRRQDRSHAQYPQGLPHPRWCRLFGRAQRRPLVLSA